MSARSLLFALAARAAHVEKVRRRPRPITTLVMPAHNDARLHVLVTGTSPLPDIFLVPRDDAPLRQDGAQWSAGADVTAEAVVLLSSVHDITVASDFRRALRAPIDQDELSAPGMSVVVLCPSGPDWPREWQSVEIIDGTVGETYRPPPDQRIDALVRAAVVNRGRYTTDTWIRPGWKF